MATNVAKQTKVTLVYDGLKRAILEGEYAPGSRIVADQVAEQFAVSTVPIREALVRLAGEGWVELSPHVGALVPPFDPNEVLENALIRAALESSAIRLATPHLNESHFRELKKYLSAMDRAAKASSPQYPRLNLEFHLLIVSACPYPRMRDLIQHVAEKTMRLRTVMFVPHYIGASQAEHREIVDALSARDADRAEALVRRHIEDAGRLLWERAMTHDGLPSAVGVSKRPVEARGGA
jgi:DNA-binding GntR family transcriptional regulator